MFDKEVYRPHILGPDFWANIRKEHDELNANVRYYHCSCGCGKLVAESEAKIYAPICDRLRRL